jgi:hypothetical protein
MRWSNRIRGMVSLWLQRPVHHFNSPIFADGEEPRGGDWHWLKRKVPFFFIPAKAGIQ